MPANEPRSIGQGFVEYSGDKDLPFCRVGEVINAVLLGTVSKWVYNVRFKDGTIVEHYDPEVQNIIWLA